MKDMDANVEKWKHCKWNPTGFQKAGVDAEANLD